MSDLVRIVVVDDHSAVPSALALTLGAQPDFEVVGTAWDVESAVSTVEAQRPHVVLMDVRMPGGGGAEATRRIRDTDPLVRILALSAHGDRASIVEMLGAGAVGFVMKGTSLQELADAIRRAVRGGMPFSRDVSEEVTAELIERLTWEDQAQRHLNRRRALVLEALQDGISMCYQPIFDLASLKVIGVEALSRFPRHPELPLKVWFTSAADLGLGAQLETAALSAALVGAAGQSDDSFIAVNLSPETAQSDGVRLALDQVDGRRVVIELTEHAPVADYDALQRRLDPLRKAGVRIAVDDAGAGYSSLQHILRLQPDFIKLDIALTSGIDREPAKRALGSALVSFAAEIGAAVIAEGVETAAELATLSQLGIGSAQGFALGRPAPGDDAVGAQVPSPLLAAAGARPPSG
jgi:EAL domain-containing protein (putative c-di-GMP-specific phosphodiesterase class I)/CheY-like chemotaxis protein